MAYRHGVYTSEVATSVRPPVESSAGLPVYIGSTPINMAHSYADVVAGKVDKIVMVSNMAEGVAKLGYAPPVPAGPDLRRYMYTLSEALFTQFSLYGVAPAIFINVLGDRAEHFTPMVDEAVQLVDGTIQAEDGASLLNTLFLDTIVVKSSDGTTTYTEGVDYLVAFDQRGQLNFQVVDGGQIDPDAEISISGTMLDPTKLDADDFIGGITPDGVRLGMELISEVFPRFGLVPGQIVCAMARDPAVAAVMLAKSQNISGVFTAISYVDLVVENGDYTDSVAAKNDANIHSPMQVALFGYPVLGGVIYSMSSHAPGVAGLVDSTTSGKTPHISPSNKPLQANGLINDDKSAPDEIFLGFDQASFVNGSGIVTGFNFQGGWKLWGNRTAAYPANSDPKDSFIAVRRMFNWVRNSLILTYFSMVDNPADLIQVQTVVDSANLWLNGLVANKALLGGRVEFLATDNPLLDLMDGIMRFRVFLTPPSPNREMEFILEYDPAYQLGLFE